MSDNTSLRGPADGSRINIHQDHEVRYWCAKFGCTKEQLIAAVRVVGVSADAVRRYLGK